MSIPVGEGNKLQGDRCTGTALPLSSIQHHTKTALLMYNICQQ